MIIGDRVLWLDLETSGSDDQEEGAALLELGIVITDIYGFREVAAQNWVYGLEAYQLKHLTKWDPVVIDMHTKSGLLAEVLKTSKTLDYREILTWIEGHIDRTSPTKFDTLGGDPKLPLAGSGVSHFDRRWLVEFLPGLADHLTYWAYDVGVLRRVFELASPRHVLRINENKPHRALDDVRIHLEEFRHYFNLIRGLKL